MITNLQAQVQNNQTQNNDGKTTADGKHPILKSKGQAVVSPLQDYHF